MLKELYRLKVLIIAVLIRHPLSILLPVIKIEHGRHRIHTEPVNMIMLHP